MITRNVIFGLVFSVVLNIDLQSHAQTIDRLSAASTGRPVTSADCGNGIVSTNQSAPTTLTLPAPGSIYPCRFTVDNGSPNMPLTLVPPAGVKIKYASEMQLAPYASATIISDGNSNYLGHVDVDTPGMTKGAGTGIHSHGFAVPDGQIQIRITGSCPATGIVGFSFGWTGQSPILFQHAMTAAPTCLQDAASDLSAQFQTNAAVLAALGSIVTYPAVLQVGNDWLLAVDLTWPFVNDPGITLSPYTAGATAVSVTTNRAPNVTDVGAGWSCSNDTTVWGRPPKTGDGVCGWFVQAPMLPPGRPVDIRSSLPFYGSAIWSVGDPTPGFQTSYFDISTGHSSNTPGRVTFLTDLMGVGTQTPQAKVHINLNSLRGDLPGSGSGRAILISGENGQPSIVEMMTYGQAPSGFVFGLSGSLDANRQMTPVVADTRSTVAVNGWNGANWMQAGALQFVVPTNWSASSNPGYWRFFATRIGEQVEVGAVDITADGITVSGSPGRTCSGPPSASFAVQGGIVIHC